VEIGGGFRMPDVMRASGCRLVEVGTTNRTYLRDYEQALSPATGLILKVHTSNYRVVGFTHAPAEDELAELASRHGLPYVYDLGSGLLRPTDLPPLTDEPSVQEAVAAGADVVTFSGDKLLCGPQAGLLVGRARYIEQIRAHPLFRAVRPDKLQLAALEATLLAYREAPDCRPDLPLYTALARSSEELQAVAGHLRSGLSRLPGVQVEIRETAGFLGSGSAPARPVPGLSVLVRSKESRPDQLADRLRRGEPIVFARVEDDALLLDLRTVFADELEPLFDALVTALTADRPSS
jgi:L-seryl-tRNA(Ser) seleniumtransferase